MEKETKKPFTFINLGVSNISPEDIVDTKSSFTYIQGTTQPSVMLPLDNVYDPFVKDSEFKNKYISTIDNHFGDSSRLDEAIERSNNIHATALALTLRAMSAISQNALNIFSNGFYSLVEPYMINPGSDKDLVFKPSSDFDFQYCVNYDQLFGVRDGFEFDSIRIPHISFDPDVLLANAIDGINRVIRRASDSYNRTIRQILIPGYFDIAAMAKDIAEADGIDFSTMDRSQWLGFVTGALNELACEDIGKIREIAEIELIQAVHEFTDIFIDLAKAAAEMPPRDNNKVVSFKDINTAPSSNPPISPFGYAQPVFYDPRA